MEQAKISSSQGPQTAHATRSKSLAKQGEDANNAAAAGGFLALLTALDGAAEVGPLAEVAGPDVLSPAGSATDAATAARDAPIIATWQGLLAQFPSNAATGAGRPAEGGVGPDATAHGAMLMNTQAGSAAPAGGSLGASVLSDGVLGGLPQGLVAETAKLDASTDFKDGPVQGTVAGLGRISPRLPGAQALRTGGVGAGDATTSLAALGDSTVRLSTAHGVATALAQVVGERLSVGLPAGSFAERAVGALAVPPGSEASALQAEAGLTGGASARGGSESSGGARAGEGHAAGGAWSEGASLLETGNTDNAAVFADPNAMGAEEQVADQVAYWVNQKTQNAELTLDRDGQPVEVSVSLSGNEAHVSFRSDQPQTRDLLDQSMAQLSDLLRSEGLVLSGMSVGTSARDASGGKGDAEQSRGRDGARQARVVSEVPAGAASQVRGGGISERSVDVFV